jgi:polysaccharide export outer membrane protein
MIILATTGCLTNRKDLPQFSQAPPLQYENNVQDPILGPNDQITINVYQHPDMSRTMEIPQSEVIFLPLAGEMETNGLTANGLRRKITSALDPFIVDPQVSVHVDSRESHRVTILGEVRSPTVITMDTDTTRLSDALGRVGGFNNFSAQNNVVLLRKENGETVGYELRVKEGLEKGIASANPVLRGGDIIYVPDSRLAKVDKAAYRMLRWLAPIVELENAIIGGEFARDILGNKDEESTSINTRSTQDINFNIDQPPAP